MSPGQTSVLLWVAFAIVSALVFAIGNTVEALDTQAVWFTAGFADAVLAGTLLWRHGMSLAAPVIIAVYAIANQWLLFFLFLSVIFYPRAAP